MYTNLETRNPNPKKTGRRGRKDAPEHPHRLPGRHSGRTPNPSPLNPKPYTLNFEPQTPTAQP